MKNNNGSLLRFSYRKPRPVPYNSAPEAEQGEFKRRISAEVGRLAGHGYVVFSEDEALRRLSAAAGYGWFPTNGKRDSPDGILNSVRQDVRDPGKGWTPRADSRSHELAHICGLSKVGAPEISKTRARLGQRLVPQVRNGHDYLAYVNGDIRLVFLPPYTPQLNPTEILWREIKRPLSCRYFELEEDLERAITEIVGGGELKDVKTMDYLAA